jgi:hypothetical protein
MQIRLRFKITQHSRDAALLISLREVFGCGGYFTTPDRDTGDFVVSCPPGMLGPPLKRGGGPQLNYLILSLRLYHSAFGFFFKIKKVINIRFMAIRQKILKILN